MPDAITESEIQYPPSILEDVTKLVQRVQTFTGATGAAIALREGEEMVCRASRGSNAPDVGMILSLEGTFAGLAVTGMKALRCDDAENDPRTDPEISRVLRIRSMAVVPVLSGTKVSGVIATFSSTVNAFSDTHMAVLKTMADGLGAAIQRWQETIPAPAVQKPAPPPPPPPAPKVEAPRPEPPRVEIPKPVPPPPPPVRQAAPPPPPPPPPAPKVEAPKPVAPPKIEPPKPVLKPVVTASAASAPAPAVEKPVEKPAVKKPDSKQQGKWKPVSVPSQKDEEEQSVSESKQESKSQSKKSEAVPFSYGMDQPAEGGKGKIIGIAAVAVLAIAGVGYYFYSSSQKPAPAPAPVATAAPAAASTAAQPAPSATPAASTTASTSAANQNEPDDDRPATPAMRVQAPGPSRSQNVQDVSAPQIAMGGGTGPNLGLPSSSNVRLAAPAPSSVVVPSRMLQRVNPIYPQAAAASRAAGDVTMSATVGTDGRIKDIKVLSGHPLLRDAAVRAFQQWRYAPSTVNGRAVDSPITVTVSFKRTE